MKRPRKLSMVYWKGRRAPTSTQTKAPFRRNQIFIFIGEIPNMPGHCVVVDKSSGRTHAGYHTENFKEIPEEKT